VGSKVSFNYDEDLGIIYAAVGSGHGHGGVELGRTADNPSNPSDWNLYCVTIDSEGESSHHASVSFYVNGVLVDSSSHIHGHHHFKLFQIELPANPPFDYWVDDIFLTNETLSSGEIRMLSNFDELGTWGIRFSFDYTLRKTRKILAVTDLGNVFSSVRPEKAILGLPLGGD